MSADVPHVVLRPWRMDDAEALAHLANDDTLWPNVGRQFPHPYTLNDARAYTGQASQQADRVFAIEVEGVLAGSIGLHDNPDRHSNRSLMTGYWVGLAFRGRGVATQALKLIVDHAFSQLDEFDRLQAYVYSWNPASARVLEKCGFTLEGRLREEVVHAGMTGDLLVYGLLRREWEQAH